MKWQIIVLLFFAVVLKAEKTIWFQEDIGSPIYKKCVFKKKNLAEYITESYYLLVDKSKSECVLLYEQRIWLKNNKFQKQVLYNHNQKQKITIFLEKDKVNIQVISGKNENSNSMKRPKQLYFPLSGRIFNHPDIFTPGKKFFIKILPVPVREVTILKLHIEVLPKARIPKSKNNKKYFVARSSEIGTTLNKRTYYYDQNGYVVYSVNKSEKEYVRKRISKPKIVLEKIEKNKQQNSDNGKINSIAPIASVSCREMYYSHAYPRDWQRVDLSPFSTAYNGESGTTGVWTSSKQFANDDFFVSSILNKLQKSVCKFSEIDFREKRKIFMGKSNFTETLVKCQGERQKKYILMLTVLKEKRSYAMVVFGTESQYRANWPTWISTLHSFVPKQ
ncbi:hypothetical protein [Candidatus Uabimicrobium sp. HlEnr_7]|uniref:hypothetical protein n=1 Tax=Candidatus Uabimicrobium helgolandensis TaxID=3095367 RepID=UPI0035589485